jgi:putative PIN family toxin of toxin-antitoxin system
MTAEFDKGPYARVVVDTNVILSAALVPHGVPAQLLDHLLQVGRLVFTGATFAELEVRIWLPKFDRYLPIERRRGLLHDASASALWVDVPDGLASRRHSRDAKDDMFIHAALASSSTRLVSGDADLLCLHPIESLHILSPRAALDELTGTSRPGPST